MRKSVIEIVLGMATMLGLVWLLEAEGAPAGHADGRGARGLPDDRGRQADRPSRIPPRGWFDVLKRVWTNISDHRLMTEAAGVTFYTLLAIFPALTALVSIFGIFADPHTIETSLSSVDGVVPGGGMDILNQQVHALVSKPGAALGFGAIAGLLAALWSSNQGTKSIFDALNIVYSEREKRSYLRRTLVSLAVTLGAIAFIMLALAGVIALPVVLNYVGLSSAGEVLLRLARWPFLIGGMALLLAVLYRYGPSRERAKWRWISWGSGIASVLWLLVSAGFSAYVGSFGSYNKTYGSLGAAIGFMTWIWLSATVVLIGAEFDAELEHQTARDTTTGPAQPRGLRGATKADQVAA